MKAIIHAGPHKTGTTSIQFFLSKNRQALAEQGFFVSGIKSPDGTPNHWWLIYLGTRSDERSTLYHNSKRAGKTAEVCKQLRKKYLDLFNAELDKAQSPDLGIQSFVLSTEEIVFLENDEVNSFYSFLLKRCESIDVIYYYRSPIDRLRSDIQQACKGGTNVTQSSLKDIPCQDNLRLRRLEPTGTNLGKVKLYIRGYKRDGEHPGWDARKDLCEAIGCDVSDLKYLDKNYHDNASLSQQMYSIVRDVNNAMPTFAENGGFNQLKRYFHNASENYKWTREDKPFKLSASDIKVLAEGKERYKEGLDYAQANDWTDLDPYCWTVYERIGKEDAAEDVTGSAFDYTPPMSHMYYINVICHFWSFLRRVELKNEQAKKMRKQG